MKNLETLELNQIAAIIKENWVDKKGKPNINYAALPYVTAMETLKKITDKYYCDGGDEIVARFLCNANSWRGDVAKLVKEELKKRLKQSYSEYSQ
jgi:hypothetical protein